MIYFVRHGQTELNQRRVLQGRSDYPLNGVGEEQAAEAAAWFKENGIRIDRIWSSPLQRAMQTARIIAGEDVPMFTDERLIEMDYGPFEGVDLTAPPQEIITFFSDFVHNPAPEGMEQLTSVVSRLGSFLEEMAAAEWAVDMAGTEQAAADVPSTEQAPEMAGTEQAPEEGTDEQAAEPIGENILISTHAIAMKGALEYLTPDANGFYWSKHIKNCAVYAAEFRDGVYGIPEEVF